MEFKGFDELQDSLQTMNNKAKEMEHGTEVSYDILFDEDFIQEHTQCNNWDDFLTNSGLGIDNADDLDNSKEWNEYVIQETSFSSWEKMLDQATENYILNQLDF